MAAAMAVAEGFKSGGGSEERVSAIKRTFVDAAAQSRAQNSDAFGGRDELSISGRFRRGFRRGVRQSRQGGFLAGVSGSLGQTSDSLRGQIADRFADMKARRDANRGLLDGDAGGEAAPFNTKFGGGGLPFGVDPKSIMQGIGGFIAGGSVAAVGGAQAAGGVIGQQVAEMSKKERLPKTELTGVSDFSRRIQTSIGDDGIRHQANTAQNTAKMVETIGKLLSVTQNDVVKVLSRLTPGMAE